MKLETLKNEIIANIKLDLPVMLTGKPGVGKSDLIREVAETIKPGTPVIDIRLSQFDPTDLAGLPFPDIENNSVIRLVDNLLPIKPVECGILFLDEITSAPAAVSAAAYQLVLDRKTGGYSIPAGWRIVAAGNGIQDRGVVNPMPSPLANRFVHYELIEDVDDWVAWAQSKNISAYIQGFLRARPELLHNMEPGRDVRAFPSPRSWAMLGKRLNVETAPDFFTIAPAYVGEGAGREFAAAIDIIADVPTVDAIATNPTGERIPENPAALYAVTGALAMNTKPENFPAFWLYVKRFKEREYTVIYMADMIRKLLDTPELEAIKTSPAFIEYATTYSDIVF